jgi:hypothetical protein
MWRDAPFVQFVRFVRRFPEGPTGKRVPAMGDESKVIGNSTI